MSVELFGMQDYELIVYLSIVTLAGVFVIVVTFIRDRIIKEKMKTAGRQFNAWY